MQLSIILLSRSVTHVDDLRAAIVLNKEIELIAVL